MPADRDDISPAAAAALEVDRVKTFRDLRELLLPFAGREMTAELKSELQEAIAKYIERHREPIFVALDPDDPRYAVIRCSGRPRKVRFRINNAEEARAL